MSNVRWKKSQDIETWFWSKVENKNGCWEWTGTKKINHGYGQVMYKKKLHVAHRIAWELARGPIPKGLLVLHKCDNRPCCNPDHLFLGTHKDNTHDMMAKGRQFTKITEDVVRVIRHACKYEIRQMEVAAYFGISRGLVGHIVRREIWDRVH